MSLPSLIRTSVSGFLKAANELKLARRMLVMTYLRMGQVDKAIATLPANLDEIDNDPAMLSVAGQAGAVPVDCAPPPAQERTHGLVRKPRPPAAMSAGANARRPPYPPSRLGSRRCRTEPAARWGPRS